MKILSFEVRNYASFDNSGRHELDEHINLIAGQNSVGKSALLQVLTQFFEPKPHRNSSQARGYVGNQTSMLECSYLISRHELEALSINLRGELYSKVPESYVHDPASFFNELALAEKFFAEMQIKRSQIIETPLITIYKDPNNRSATRSESIHEIRYNVNTRQFMNGGLTSGQAENIGSGLYRLLRESIYFFSAHRTPQSTSNFGRGIQLLPNASNLAEVLNKLQAEYTSYKRYIANVRRVLPAIKWVSVRAHQSSENQLEIIVWNVEESTERDDLAHPLSECGTGVGHVLAILYIVHRMNGSIIIIDEPNSFLHPGAARALSEILAENVNNQFIISTHAAEVITASRPERLFNLRLENEETVITSTDTQRIAEIRLLLTSLGVRLTDVLGYESIVWVEGPTEVTVLPLILNSIGRKLGGGVVFAALRSTGDLESKQAVAFSEIYRNISQATSLVPQPLFILLDGDKRGNSRIESIEKLFPESVRYIERYTFENYLLSVSALTHYLNSLPSFQQHPLNEDAVSKWFVTHGNETKYKCPSVEVFSDAWMRNVDATKMLDNFVQDISEAKENFQKPEHSIFITEWLLERQPEALAELIETLKSIIPE